MTRARALFAIAVAACGSDGNDTEPDAAPVDAPLDDGLPPDGPRVDPLDGIGQVMLVGSGYMFTEGPQWRPSADEFVFSDIPANTIYRWSEGSGDPTVFRSPSGNANGLAVDTTGNVLLACEHGNRRVSRGDGASPEPVVDRFEGLRLNSPNDLTVGQDGTIYFTDPPYGIQDADRELSFMGVFRVPPVGDITAEYRGALSERPNGIALWPFAPPRLYVGDSEANHVHVFDVATDGTLSNRRLFASTAATPDGMAIDTAGNLFVATSEGVQVFAFDGTLWGTIDVPMQPSNVAFGGVDSRTLLITARTGVYRVTLANPGWPRF